ncbi:OmpA family protein [Gymnodinialimonas hymeniacidonis]|uniref:OmpA family protein n=1 Tax=Gymnodinialimonas hymeniacidonis TaxID=3126508 RepID=UPI0034C610EF
MRLQGVRKFGGLAALCLAGLCAPTGVAALDLAFPGEAELVLSTGPTQGQHPIATGPFRNGQVPLALTDGMVQTLTWQVEGEGVSTASILRAVNEQLEAQDYEVTFTCFAAACGGFDFRHAVPVGQAPEMHVDLGNYQYLTASTEREAGAEQVALMISQGGATSFVHMARVMPAEAVETNPVVLSSRSPDAAEGALAPQMDPGDLVGMLTSIGSAPLDDLRFATGASQLSGEMYPSLVALAAFLEANPARRVVLVGHTDASGSLSGNISLSQARADAVRRFLVNQLDVNPGQIEAEGIGYLSPRASNTTSEGREANRRVEVVLADAG